MDTALAAKADQAAMDAALAAKADQAAVDTALAAKTDQTALDQEIADRIADVDAEEAARMAADALKADQAAVDTALAAKADQAAMDCCDEFGFAPNHPPHRICRREVFECQWFKLLNVTSPAFNVHVLPHHSDRSQNHPDHCWHYCAIHDGSAVEDIQRPKDLISPNRHRTRASCRHKS